MGVSQRVSSNAVRVGAPLTYAVIVTNSGPSTTTGVILTDTLPAGATLHTAAPTQGSCLGAAPIICNLGLLPMGANITVTVAVTPTAMGMITNTVTATADQFDPVLANNTANETTIVLHELYLPLIVRGP